MIQVKSTNITSPLGMTTEANYQALLSGRSVLASYQDWRGLKDPFEASMFTADQISTLAIEGYTRFESLVLHSISEALTSAQIDVQRTVLVLSTTKGNVEELGPTAGQDGAYLHPGETARKIARHFGIENEPIVVCNACISGVSAMLTASRLLESGCYDTAIVCGADCLTPFMVSGFQSFKALSPYPCRPFDIERLGLNIGEAASTVILQHVHSVNADSWVIEAGCANNDAYHVSAPSPVGEGMQRAIEKTLQGVEAEGLATISVHGTATMFNDQMESKAIQAAGLSTVPLSALKGYYGHTMGAAGLLETIITMRALDEGLILPNRGFEEIGVSGKVNICAEAVKTDKHRFLKIISGFGGCNAAILLDKGNTSEMAQRPLRQQTTTHHVQLNPSTLIIDGQQQVTSERGKSLLTEIYKKYVGDYAKFYKMDMLSRLAFVASELLIKQEEVRAEGESRAILLFNRTTSIDSDRKHIATLSEGGIPSPSIFLYTLPNITNGEIAIRNGYKGETSFYILTEKDEALMQQMIDATLQHTDATSLLTGWIDYESEEKYEADMRIIEITRDR